MGVMFWPSLKPGMLRTPQLQLLRGGLQSPELLRGGLQSPKLLRGGLQSPELLRGGLQSPELLRGGLQSPVTTRRTEESRGCSRRTPPLARLCRAAQQKMCNGINDEEEVLDEKKRFLAEVGAAAMKGKV